MDTIELRKGDCLELMEHISDNSIDLIITDPPYELDSTTCDVKSSSIKQMSKFLCKEYKDITNGFEVELVFNEFKRITKKFNMFIFCSNKQISKIMNWGEKNNYSTHLLIWHKYNAPPFANGVWRNDCEFIIHIREKGATFKGDSKLKSKIQRHNLVRSEYGHPTEKPVKLLEKYIKIGSNKGDVIFDAFAGSGSIGEACYNLERNCIMIEKEQKYCNMILSRMKKNNNKKLGVYF